MIEALEALHSLALSGDLPAGWERQVVVRYTKRFDGYDSAITLQGDRWHTAVESQLLRSSSPHPFSSLAEALSWCEDPARLQDVSPAVVVAAD